MSELTLTLIKVGFLALLWMFVLSSVSVIRPTCSASASRPPRDKAAAEAAKNKRRKKPRGAPTQLVISEGSNAGVSVPLGREPILLGRGADATIRLDDDYVSTRHARFVPHGEDWYVEDLGSTNGTYIGSQRITTPMVVAIGVQVRVGKTIAELKK